MSEESKSAVKPKRPFLFTILIWLILAVVIIGLLSELAYLPYGWLQIIIIVISGSLVAVSKGQGDIGVRAFALALCLGVVGELAFFGGIAAAFGRAGNWSNYLSEFGVGMLILAGIINSYAVVAGIIFISRTRQFLLWWPVSLLAAIGSLYGAWVALHL